MDERDQISEAVRARIIQAAKELHAESDFSTLPTVSAVRRRANCDMNAASEVLREWKTQLTARPAPVAVVVPDNVMQAFTEAVSVSWAVCQDLANANLRSAQADWDRERETAEGMRRELADSWEEVSNELEIANRRLAELLRAQEQADVRISQLSEDLAKQTARADQAEFRLGEMEIRLNERKSELDNAHEEIKLVRQELTDARSLHLSEKNQLEKVSASEIEKAKSELANFQGRADELAKMRDKQIETLQQELGSAGIKLNELVQELATLRAETKVAGEASKDQRKQAASEAHRMAERFVKLQNERDESVRLAANLQGQLQAVQRQCDSLMLKNAK
jgi:chromosome segregation ATPase